MGRRWLWLLLALLVLAVFFKACVRFVPSDNPVRQPAVAQLPSVSGLRIPVAGVSPQMLRDTFTEARSEGRRHDAIDIVATRGTPVLAAAGGRVEKLFESMRGGTTIYIRSPDGRWIDYYAHLDRYAPGMREGLIVPQGEIIGAIGSTGDAAPDAPHLHFAINRAEPGDRWYQGTPVNPYPLLMAGRR